MEIRRLTEADFEAFWALRLQSLRESPAAFLTTYEEAALTAGENAERLRTEYAAGDHFILGAFDGEQLAGVVGFRRETRAKTRHKGVVWGMYVAPEARGRGAGRALLSALIARARALPGLERLDLGVVTTQAAARGLYLSLGFRTYCFDRRTIKADGEYFDEELMALWLT